MTQKQIAKLQKKVFSLWRILDKKCDAKTFEIVQDLVEAEHLLEAECNQ